MASASTSVTLPQNWLRGNLIGELCLTDALLTILHNTNNDPRYAGLPQDGAQLYARMVTFKNNYQHHLKKVIRTEQWNIICPSSGISNSAYWDITILKVVIQYEVLHLLPPNAGWKNAIEPADFTTAADVCRSKDIRNKLKHGTTKELANTTYYNSIVTEVEDLLHRLGYKNMKLFNNLKTGSLELFNSQILKILEDKIDNINKNYVGLQNETTRNKSDNYNNQKKVQSLEDEINSFKGIVNGINETLCDLDRNGERMFNNLTKSIDDLGSKLKQEKQEINNRFHDHEERIQDHEERIKTIEQRQKVQDDTFQSTTNEAKQPVIIPECSMNDIKQSVINLSIIDGEGKSKLEQCNYSFNYNVLLPVKHFMGRQDEIDKLHQIMMNYYGDLTNPLLGVVLTGLSGVGKTEMIRKYCLKHLDFYEGNALWINAQNADTITNDFLAIGGRIGLPMKQADGSTLPIKTIAQNIYNCFVLGKGNETQRKVLFVFDNLNNPDDIKQFQPNISNTPYILITSQKKDWDPHFKFIDLNVFSPQTAQQFLQRNMNETMQSNQEANESLLRLLDGHPLALHQAISYINRHRIIVEKYISLFKKYYDKVLLADHDCKAALATISLSIDKLTKQTDSAVAIKLLRLSAYFDGRDVKKGLLLMFTYEDIVELNDALNILYKHSIISNQYINMENETNYEEQILTVHPLIQYTLKQNQKDLEEQLLKLIFDTFFEELNSEDNLVNKGKYWFSHFIYLFDQNDTKEILLDHSMHQQNLLIDIFEMKGRLYKMYEILLSLEKRLESNVNDDNVLRLTRYYTAMTLQKLGKYKESLQILRNVEKEQLSIFGEHHPCLLTTQHDIAQGLSYLGKHDESLQILRKVEEQQLSIFGEHHPCLLTTQHDIAQELSYLGKHDESLQILRQVEKQRLSIFGENHPHLLTTQFVIIQELSHLGKHDESLQILRNVEKQELSIFGENNPNLLTTQFVIAQELSYLGKHHESLQILRNVEKQQLSIFGENHPNLLITQFVIAQELSHFGKHHESLQILKNVEQEELSIFGENHPDLLTTQRSIAQELSHFGKHHESLEILKNVEKEELSIFAENHPNLLKTQFIIAQELSYLGKHDESIQILRNVEKQRLSIFGENHPDLLTTQRSIAQELSRLGKDE